VCGSESARPDRLGRAKNRRCQYFLDHRELPSPRRLPNRALCMRVVVLLLGGVFFALFAFDPRCAEASVLERFETNPPAGLYGAPPGRPKTVIRNPETLRKILI